MGFRDRLTEWTGERFEEQARHERDREADPQYQRRQREREEELERARREARESRKYRKLAKHGEVPAPGKATLDLPSGKVKLRYVESIRGSEEAGGGLIKFYAPKGLRVKIAPVGGGEEIEVTQRKLFQKARRLPGEGTWVTFGSPPRIPKGGPYEVTVEGGREGAAEPRVVFG